MELPRALSSKEVPKYVIGYWLVSWALIFFLVFVLEIVFSITPDGKYLERIDCIQSAGNGPNRECVEWGDPYYEPAGREIKGLFIRIGILTGIISLLIGVFHYVTMKMEEKSIIISDAKKRTIKKISGYTFGFFILAIFVWNIIYFFYRLIYDK